MNLAELLTLNLVLPDLQATERWEAIAEMLDLLIAEGKLQAADREVILAALRQREETMSTGIGFGIAIPHASSERVQEVVAAFGRSKKGVEFDALDNGPVRFLVLFLVPQGEFQTHLRTLAAIAKLLNDSAVRTALEEAETAEEILAVIRGK